MRTFESTYGASPARRARLKEMLRLPEERHRKFLADYDRYYGGGAAAAAERARVIRAPVSTDADVVRTTFQFLRSEEDDAELGAWEARMARRYYDKLFKEYCIADLSRYREQKIGMRWRVEKEVVTGKGPRAARSDAARRHVSPLTRSTSDTERRGEKRSARQAPRVRVVRAKAQPRSRLRLPEGIRSERRRTTEAERRARRRRTTQTTAARDDDDDSDSDGDDDGVDATRTGDGRSRGRGRRGRGRRGRGRGLVGEEATVAAAERGDAVWSGKATVAAAEPTREEEFDRYFEDMFA